MLHRYLVPMSASVWSTPPDRMLDFPAMTLIRSWHNHGFLGLHTQHPWYTVVGGAQSYIAKLAAPFRDRVQLGRRAVRVERQGGRARITTEDGAVREFDKVILACHGDIVRLDLFELGRGRGGEASGKLAECRVSHSVRTRAPDTALARKTCAECR